MCLTECYLLISFFSSFSSHNLCFVVLRVCVCVCEREKLGRMFLRVLYDTHTMVMCLQSVLYIGLGEGTQWWVVYKALSIGRDNGCFYKL